MNNYVLCDVHGHFLPGMDDGSRSVEESVNMLKTAKNQGVERMFATPHYYPVESVQTFLARRQESAQKLSQALQGHENEVPVYQLGAEVAYRQGIGSAEDLEKLCLGRSRYMLLELPFAPWENTLFRDIGNIANVRGIIPIIAHVERYWHMQRQDVFERLMEQDVLLQINASTMTDWRTRNRACNMFKEGTAHLLGSDCHNMTSRAPNLGQAAEYLRKRKMEYLLIRASELCEEIFEGV